MTASVNYAHISRQLISYTIKRWRETGSTADRPRVGRPRTIRTPRRNKGHWSELVEIPDAHKTVRSLKWVIRVHIDSKLPQSTYPKHIPFKRRKVYDLTMQHRSARLERSKAALLQRYADGDVERIVFLVRSCSSCRNI